MKTPIFILLLFLGMTVTNLSAQDSNYSEKTWKYPELRFWRWRVFRLLWKYSQHPAGF